MSSSLVETALNMPKSLNLQEVNLSKNAAVTPEKCFSNNLLDFYNRVYAKTDRRTQNLSLNKEQRTNSDRRQKTRIPQISDDVYQVQKTVNNVQSISREIKSDINKFDEFINNNSVSATSVLTALSPIIPFRRVTSVPKKLQDHDYGGATIALGVAATLFPEDLRDVKDAVRQLNSLIMPQKLKDLIKKSSPKFYDNFINYVKKYDPKDFQVPFSFVRGSFLENIVNKHPNKLGYLVHKGDIPLIETKFGQRVKKLLNVTESGYFQTARKVPVIRHEGNNYIIKEMRPVAYKLKGSKFGKLVCRSLQRMTVYGSLTLCLVSIPSIIKAFNKPKIIEEKLNSARKQTLKSAINIVISLASIGLGGALLAPIGPLGSVVGMGLGCTIGGFISGQICKQLKIDKNYL